VAERNDDVVGIAMSGPPDDVDSVWDMELFVMHVYADHHGSGVGSLLLEAVIDPGESVVLWVADPNPRAQAFYRKSGFVLDGASRTDEGMRAVRMVRLPAT
jgi:ribosomal protein S18 acetylase RimI-like enzyme